MAVSPEAGTSMTAGGSVTLTVSRGLDYGDTAQIPDVVGMTKNEAITTLGKWADIQIAEQQSSQKCRQDRSSHRIHLQLQRMGTPHTAIRMKRSLS